MKAGAEPKKVAILAALLIVAAVVLYLNVFSGDSASKRTVSAVPVVNTAPAPAAPVAAPVTATPAPSTARGERKRASKNATVSQFKIREGVEPGQDKPDPATIDPTLRLDLLAKLQKVEPAAAMRNIFQYGAAPPPPPAAVKPVELPKNTGKIAINQLPPAPVGPPPPPPAPTAPPMTFKYYGYKVAKGRKEAFLLDGDDIIIAAENDSVKRGRYRVVRIGVNSITIEDTQFKSTQTLPLQEDAVV